jgi:hypothetical protein
MDADFEAKLDFLIATIGRFPPSQRPKKSTISRKETICKVFILIYCIGFSFNPKILLILNIQKPNLWKKMPL